MATSRASLQPKQDLLFCEIRKMSAPSSGSHFSKRHLVSHSQQSHIRNPQPEGPFFFIYFLLLTKTEDFFLLFYEIFILFEFLPWRLSHILQSSNSFHRATARWPSALPFCVRCEAQQYLKHSLAWLPDWQIPACQQESFRLARLPWDTSKSFLFLFFL